MPPCTPQQVRTYASTPGRKGAQSLSYPSKYQGPHPEAPETREAGISPAAVEELHDEEQRAPDVLIAAEITVHSNAEQRHVVPACKQDACSFDSSPRRRDNGRPASGRMEE